MQCAGTHATDHDLHFCSLDGGRAKGVDWLSLPGPAGQDAARGADVGPIPGVPAEYAECVALCVTGIGSLMDSFAIHIIGHQPEASDDGILVSEEQFDKLWLASQDEYEKSVDKMRCAVKLFWWWSPDTMFRDILQDLSSNYYPGVDHDRAICMVRRSLDAQEWPQTYLIDAHSPFYRWTDLDRSSPRHTIWGAALGDACRPPSKPSLPEILWRELVQH